MQPPHIQSRSAWRGKYKSETTSLLYFPFRDSRDVTHTETLHALLLRCYHIVSWTRVAVIVTWVAVPACVCACDTRLQRDTTRGTSRRVRYMRHHATPRHATPRYATPRCAALHACARVTVRTRRKTVSEKERNEKGEEDRMFLRRAVLARKCISTDGRRTDKSPPTGASPF